MSDSKEAPRPKPLSLGGFLFTGTHLINFDEVRCIECRPDKDGRLEELVIVFEHTRTGIVMPAAARLYQYLCEVSGFDAQSSSSPVDGGTPIKPDPEDSSS